MNTKLLTVGVVVVLIVTASVVLFKDTPVAEAPEESPTSEAKPQNQFVQQAPSTSAIPAVATNAPAKAVTLTIGMDDTGFSTTNVNIGKGTVVTFVNNGQALHWPASDQHPTHLELPDFDAKKGLNTGETYSYTFDKVGTWGFHDHLNASAKGTITVK